MSLKYNPFKRLKRRSRQLGLRQGKEKTPKYMKKMMKLQTSPRQSTAAQSRAWTSHLEKRQEGIALENTRPERREFERRKAFGIREPEQRPTAERRQSGKLRRVADRAGRIGKGLGKGMKALGPIGIFQQYRAAKKYHKRSRMSPEERGT